MLCLRRNLNETIHIGPDIVITVVRITRGEVRLGITAPDDVKILRGELVAKPKEEGAQPCQE